MDGIQHRIVKVNGINMHIAEKGQGPVILFLHGFPELWYSWRHQITALASLGYRAVAPDLRGFGDTDARPEVTSYTCFHVIGDLVGLIDTVAPSDEKVFVVGHDWGALMAWFLCLFRPDRVKALVNLSVVFNPFGSNDNLIEALRAYYGDNYYMCRFQKPGEIEAEFAQIGTETVIKEFFTFWTRDRIFLPKGKGFGRPPNTPIALPSWLSEEDVKYFTTKFDKKGFTGAMNYYRNINLNHELLAPWAGSQIQIPTKFIIGDLDMTYHMPGVQEYIHKGGFKRDVPLLEKVVIMEGVGHFINQGKSNEISKHIYDFFNKF
ncbi:AB hydrolase-1 domain-containing protein [Citrus sinensis]|nr:AB hydrolase-1 domain-containing protein [Citrus sinensis]